MKAELEKQGLRKVLKRATEYRGEVEDLKLYTKTGKRVKKIPADFGPGLTKFNERRGGKGDGNRKGKEDGGRGEVGGRGGRRVKKGKSLVNVQVRRGGGVVKGYCSSTKGRGLGGEGIVGNDFLTNNRTHKHRWRLLRRFKWTRPNSSRLGCSSNSK